MRDKHGSRWYLFLLSLARIEKFKDNLEKAALPVSNWQSTHIVNGYLLCNKFRGGGKERERERENCNGIWNFIAKTFKYLSLFPESYPPMRRETIVKFSEYFSIFFRSCFFLISFFKKLPLAVIFFLFQPSPSINVSISNRRFRGKRHEEEKSKSGESLEITSALI